MSPPERRREPFWVQITPYILALLSVIAAVSTWAINTQAKQDERISKIEEHAAVTDRFVMDALKEIKSDIKDIKKAVQ